MYGTVARMRVKAGQEKGIIELFNQWDRELRPKVEGAVAGYIYKLDRDPHEMVMVAVFRDRQAYERNAQSQDQDAWYRRFRELLEADPEWQDGEIIAAS